MTNVWSMETHCSRTIVFTGARKFVMVFISNVISFEGIRVYSIQIGKNITWLLFVRKMFAGKSALFHSISPHNFKFNVKSAMSDKQIFNFPCELLPLVIMFNSSAHTQLIIVHYRNLSISVNRNVQYGLNIFLCLLSWYFLGQFYLLFC